MSEAVGKLALLNLAEPGRRLIFVDAVGVCDTLLDALIIRDAALHVVNLLHLRQLEAASHPLHVLGQVWDLT